MAFSNDRTFGVEIELFNVSRSRLVNAMNDAGFTCFDGGYTHAVSTAWKVVNDSSVKGIGGRTGRIVEGCELVSPILKGEEGLRTLAGVIKLLRRLKARVNDTCGFHVHVGATDLGLEGMKKLAQVYVKYEATLDSLVKEHRAGDGNHYCRSLRKWEDPKTVIARVENARTLEQVAEAVNPAGSSSYDRTSRYHKLNLTPYWRQGTVEFRHKEGTMDGKTVVAWVRLCVSLVEGAATRTSEFWNRKLTAGGSDRTARFFACYVADRRASAHFRAALALAIAAA